MESTIKLSCCIIAITIAFLSSRPALANNFLVIPDGDTENSITPLLTANGNTVSVFPGTDVTFDGTADLSPYDGVILLDGEGFEQGMPVAGQLQLKAYVNGGGGLLLTEWVAFEFDKGRYAQMGDLIPLRRSSGRDSNDTYTVVADHEVTAGLPSSFTIPTHGYNVGSAVSGEVLVTSSLAGDAVVADLYGLGRIVQMSTAGNYLTHEPFDQGAASENFNQLFVQAAEWTAGDRCHQVDAIDDQFSMINDGTTSEFFVLSNDECANDVPISVVSLPGDLQPDRGGVAITDGTKISYTPASGFVGFEEFSYTAQDAGLAGGGEPPAVDQDTARVVVNVAADTVPDAQDDVATTLQTQSVVIDVLGNDFAGNPPSTLELETQPAAGSASVLVDNTIRYTPNPNLFGEVSFEYRLIDLNGDSDVATVTVGVFFVRGQVEIDIMPNDAGNNVNLRAGPGSGFEIAILSAGEFFDAPAQIDPLTLKFGPRQANIWGTPKVRDVDQDGDGDLIVKILTGQTGIACGDTQATLSGSTFESQSISGTDAINTFNCPRVRKRY